MCVEGEKLEQVSLILNETLFLLFYVLCLTGITWACVFKRVVTFGNWQSFVYYPFVNWQALSKTQLCTSNTKTKQKYLASKKTDFEEQIAKNNKWMERIQSEMQLLETDLDAKAQLEQCQTVVQLQLENMELRRNCQLYKRHVHAQEKDAQNTERWETAESWLCMVWSNFKQYSSPTGIVWNWGTINYA